MCWVLMPDHWHCLLELGETEVLSRSVGRAKSTAGRALRRECGIPGEIWSPGFHERAMRREESVLEAARYIVANPVRAGLVRNPRDYPYWDAVWLAATNTSKSSPL